MLQWGRVWVDADIGDQAGVVVAVEHASMGPRLGRRGYLTRLIVSFASSSASMGPRLGRRGYYKFTADTHRLTVLQWGRVWVDADMSAMRSGTGWLPSLQWGRVWVDADMVSMGSGGSISTRCFNGAASG